jgi:transposase
MKQPGVPPIQVPIEELEGLVEQARPALSAEGYQKLRAAIHTLVYVTELLEQKETTLAALRELLCPASTEKTDKVLQQAGVQTGGLGPESAAQKPKRAAAGHGRNGAAAYHGAQKVPVPHASLKAGDACPDGCGGKVYPQRDPGVLVRIKGQAPLAATVYELEKLRCNLCGNVYTAAAPPEAGEKKYDESAASMIAMLRYGSGFPWNRLENLEPPAIQMCDALSRNVPKFVETMVANCNAHSRRNFVKVTPNFPEECRFVLESMGEVYGYDEQARTQGLSAEERLRFHQEHSRPVMDKLHSWCTAQFAERKVEPNSGLGQAISYLLKHWEKLTLFLRQAGAPLDNNLVERALKKAILHRKNSLFYKTRKGAQMGDLFMSLIHTCELNGVNAFDYLTELQRHAEELKQNPSAWMPWNYRETLARLAAPAAA